MSRDMWITSALFGLFIGCLAAIVSLSDVSLSDKDSSNPAAVLGFAIRTDCLTGVQYLEATQGAVTPRLNAEGRVVVSTEGCK